MAEFKVNERRKTTKEKIDERLNYFHETDSILILFDFMKYFFMINV